MRKLRKQNILIWRTSYSVLKTKNKMNEWTFWSMANLLLFRLRSMVQTNLFCCCLIFIKFDTLSECFSELKTLFFSIILNTIVHYSPNWCAFAATLSALFFLDRNYLLYCLIHIYIYIILIFVKLLKILFYYLIKNSTLYDSIRQIWEWYK